MKKYKIKKIAKSILPTKYGQFDIIIYKDNNGSEHVVLLSGKNFSTNKSVLVRVHSECITSEVFHSQKCDCKQQLDLAMKKIGKVGGVIIYLRQEGRGIGLGNKIKAYHLQEQGLDTVEANVKLGFASDKRDYKVACLILDDLGINKIKLLTNNPDKIKELKKCGIEIEARVSIEIKPKNGQDKKYLKTKKDKMGHLLRQV
ncbi:MAG TPA: GTP cyclohydrolase II [Candidatus Magasanikbacteria bacterium]|nr:GTP cyclohydrolase II [Candidatus Magasanikbacteria bacterium]